MNDNRPEWVPKDGGKEYTTNVMKGIQLDSNSKKKTNKNSRKHIEAKDFVKGVLANDLTIFSRAITLVESNRPDHIKKTQEILKELLPHTGNSIRIGITGPPGAGKSTFIEALGMYLTGHNLKVAVLAIDPSSSLTKGSVLGDKTRMENLSKEKNSYIRPSASGGTLGGVAKKTRETILLCEAAGYDVILIETIGVGQSEITVRSMVDFFMLMLLPGSGDELQGIKKGVVELADLMVVNKAEGANKTKANMTRAAYANALNLLQPATEGWKTEVKTCSALDNIGIDDIWTTINNFQDNTKNSGIFEIRRKNQMLEWMHSMLEEGIKSKFYSNPKISNKINDIEALVTKTEITPTAAVNELLNMVDIK